jgi:hypothetical protein
MSTLKHKEYIPILNSVGADYMVVSDAPIVTFSILIGGGTGDSRAVTLPQTLADANYAVFVQAEGVNDAHVDESTKTTTGFTVLKGTGDFADEVLNIIVVGSRLPKQAPKV